MPGCVGLGPFVSRDAVCVVVCVLLWCVVVCCAVLCCVFVCCCGVLWCCCCVVVLLWCCVVVLWCGLRLHSKRFFVAPAVYPRVFEILTTSTFGALRKYHNVSQKTNKTKHVVHVWSAMYHEVSRTQQKSKKGTLREIKKKISRP